MSNHLLNEAWKVNGLGPVKKLLLLSLADRANADSECWPSQEDIARRCGISIRSVVTGIESLRKDGHISTTNKGHKATSGKSYLTYKVHPIPAHAPPAHAPPAHAPPAHAPPAHAPDGTDTRKLSDLHTQTATPPLIEPSVNNPQMNPKGEPETPLAFEPVPRGLFLKEYTEMIANARKAVAKIRNTEDNWHRDLTDSAIEVIMFLESKAEPGWEQRKADILARPGSYEKTKLKPSAARDALAWRQRIEEIERSRDGVKA